MSTTPEYTQSELPAISLLQKMVYQYYNGATQDGRMDITETKPAKI